ncbi:hypothetical protein TWF694_000097 [Orbilia ellipsospora]|uniref:Uncharacterized protein n=1 Tax=Orbilia ellipsospora TaxID=2528407 RepID=A0AAV9XN08_9PEZI
MARHIRSSRLDLASFIILHATYVSGVIINVVVSDVAEIWRENDSDSLRRKDPEPVESMYRLCRPPSDKPWLGVFAIDPRKSSCAQTEGSSPSWELAQSSWERPEFFPKEPGTLLEIRGPTGVPIMNTQHPDQYLTYGPRGKGVFAEASEPSKWLVERFGNNKIYETITEKTPVQVGDTLRFWEPDVLEGFKQLFLHKPPVRQGSPSKNKIISGGSPMRLNRERPIPDEDSKEDFATAVRKIRAEYPHAELRVASLGNDEIVGPGAPTRTDKITAQLGKAKNALSGLFRGAYTQSQLIGLGLSTGYDIMGHDPDRLVDEIKTERTQVQDENPVSIGVKYEEESKQSDDGQKIYLDAGGQVVAEGRVSRSKSGNSANSGRSKDKKSWRDDQTQYNTAWGDSQFLNPDSDEEDRLGDIALLNRYTL